jgi:hypothetical protein
MPQALRFFCVDTRTRKLLAFSISSEIGTPRDASGSPSSRRLTQYAYRPDWHYPQVIHFQ